jgi:hypothetical protein
MPAQRHERRSSPCVLRLRVGNLGQEAVLRRGGCRARVFPEFFWNVAETSADEARWARLIERQMAKRTSRTGAKR